MPIITARREGKCKRCGHGIVVGERIDYTRSLGALHLACSEGEDPEQDIISHYGYRTRPPTAGLGETDQQAFDKCVAEFGYVPTVRALYEHSSRAKQAQDGYHTMKLRRQGIRLRGA
jgi:hypothetical protein